MAELSRYPYCLVVMAKAPVAGAVKSRLIPGLGVSRATAVYSRLLKSTLSRLSAIEGQKILSCSPDGRHAVFRKLASAGDWRRQCQPRGDLGRRMSAIFSACQRNYPYTILIGSDLANIDQAMVEHCLQLLIDGKEVVIGATHDGGYGLIGMARLHSGLFRDIPWSSNRVLAVTMNRARRMGLKTAVVPGLWDIDDYGDYRAWLQAKACVV